MAKFRGMGMMEQILNDTQEFFLYEDHRNDIFTPL
jgi:hypothetical protein